MNTFLAKTLNPDFIKNRTKTVVLIWFLSILGWLSAIMLLLFLFLGSFTIIDLHLDVRNGALTDVCLSILFFLQHSILVRKGFRRWLIRILPQIYHHAFYGLSSCVTLLLVLILWQKSPIVIVHADGMIYWILRGLFFLPMIGFLWGIRSLGSFDALGIEPLIHDMSNRPGESQQIMIKGPYRWTRHPLYFFLIVLIWLNPVLTLDRLLFDILWTIWIVVATFLEDRDLHREFDSQYREYSSKVPMLFPYRVSKSVASNYRRDGR